MYTDRLTEKKGGAAEEKKGNCIRPDKFIGCIFRYEAPGLVLW